MSEQVFGLVEYGSDSDLVPQVIVGPTRQAVDREAVRTINLYIGCRTISEDMAEFLAEFPYPDLKDPRAVTRWLEELWEFTTVPCYSRLGSHDVTVLEDDE